MFDLPSDIAELLQFDGETRAVASREGKKREFKRTFIPMDFSEYTKTLGAFANADGGVLLLTRDI